MRVFAFHRAARPGRPGDAAAMARRVHFHSEAVRFALIADDSFGILPSTGEKRMKRQLWIPLALGIVGTFIFLDRRASRYATASDEWENAADRTDLWGSKQRVAGTGRGMVGKVKEGVGRITGDDDLAGEGIVDQAAGAVQDTAGKAANAASDTIREFNRY